MKIRFPVLLCFMLVICSCTLAPEDNEDTSQTIIMKGGFETGTILTTDSPPGDWTFAKGEDGVVNLVSSDVHSGAWAAEAEATTTEHPGYSGPSLRRSFEQAGNTIYARLYFKLKSGHNLLETDYRYFNIMWIGTSAIEEVCSVRLVHLAEPKVILKFCYYFDDGVGHTPDFDTQETAFEILDDVWYYLEFYAKQHDTAGEFKLWAAQDGGSPEQILWLTGLDTGISRPVELFSAGINLHPNEALGTLGLDDYAVAAERIGID